MNIKVIRVRGQLARNQGRWTGVSKFGNEALVPSTTCSRSAFGLLLKPLCSWLECCIGQRAGRAVERA